MSKFKIKIEMRDGVIAEYYGNRYLFGYIPHHPYMDIPEGKWVIIKTSSLNDIIEDNGKYYYETNNNIYWSSTKLEVLKGIPTEFEDYKTYND